MVKKALTAATNSPPPSMASLGKSKILYFAAGFLILLGLVLSIFSVVSGSKSRTIDLCEETECIGVDDSTTTTDSAAADSTTTASSTSAAVNTTPATTAAPDGSTPEPTLSPDCTFNCGYEMVLTSGWEVYDTQIYQFRTADKPSHPISVFKPKSFTLDGLAVALYQLTPEGFTPQNFRFVPVALGSTPRVKLYSNDAQFTVTTVNLYDGLPLFFFARSTSPEYSTPAIFELHGTTNNRFKLKLAEQDLWVSLRPATSNTSVEFLSFDPTNALEFVLASNGTAVDLSGRAIGDGRTISYDSADRYRTTQSWGASTVVILLLGLFCLGAGVLIAVYFYKKGKRASLSPQPSASAAAMKKPAKKKSQTKGVIRKVV